MVLGWYQKRNLIEWMPQEKYIGLKMVMGNHTERYTSTTLRGKFQMTSGELT